MHQDHAAGEALLSIFDRVFVINLPERTDRREEMSWQLARLGLGFDDPRVVLFPACRFDDAAGFHSPAIRGCFMSHLGVARQALEAGARRWLVLEDDADFSRHFAGRIGGLAENLAAREWGFLYGWEPGHYDRAEDPEDVGLMPVAPDTPVMLAHFMGMSAETGQRLVPYLEAMLGRPHGDAAGGPMHVDGAFSWFRAAHPEVVTLCTRTPLSVQRSSRSDIHGGKWFDRIEAARPLVTALRRARSALRSR